MNYDTRRHVDVFDPATFTDPIHVIGVGGIGGRAVELIARFGCGFTNAIHAWDGDKVELQNPANQVYRQRDIGLYKTNALAQLVSDWSGAKLIEHCEYVEGKQSFSGVVFACLDSMETRWDIWEACIKRNPDIPLFIETRMDATRIVVHVVDPNNEAHIKKWEAEWYPDAQANNLGDGCGGHVAIPTTVMTAASYAVWEMVRFHAIRNGADDVLNNRIKLDKVSHELTTFQW